jgi:phospholipid/cholesterol/gamma-HCH transport system ATP-binding protein
MRISAALPSDEDAPILRFDDVRLAVSGEAGLSFSIEATLGPGELILVHPGDEQHERSLMDAAAGRLAPQSGSVRFLGRDWHTMPAHHANALRGMIGFVFARGRWLPQLSVVDNVILAQMHHTRRPYPEIRHEASGIAMRLGLPGLPLGLPGEVAAADLVRAGCVGAFLGAPRLIVLECPVVAPPADLLPLLINAMRSARDKGTAILWSTLDSELLYDSSIPANRRLRLRGDRLVAVGPSG